jgi:glycosyltransferase involved in cell wall biosynthesis
MPQNAALKYMEDTDYLLLTMTNDISVPGKLFEYMATGKPVLAVAAQGSEVDEILRETGAGMTAAPDNLRTVQAMLIRAFEAWRNGTKLVESSAMAVRRYERPRLAQEYSNLMRSIGLRRENSVMAGQNNA